MKQALSILFAFIPFLLAAQAPVTAKISGVIIDAATKTPVEYASIAVYSTGSTAPVNGTTSNSNGNFTIDKIPYGEYTLKIYFIGYKDYVLTMLLTNEKSAFTVNILLEPVATQLQDVEITSKAAAVKNKIDKLIYNPQNDIAAQGGTAIDVLKKVPMVTVDIDGNIELLGSPGINFLINGKPSTIFGSSLADALQSIPASQIKNIEVITNPGARYDSHGTGGIINIILKDSNVEGFNGSVNGALGTRVQNGSVNLNVRKGAFSANAFFSGNNQSKTTSLNSTRLSNSDGIEVLNQNGQSTVTRGGYQAGLGLDYKITPKDNVTASFRYNGVNSHTGGYSGQGQTTFDDSGIPSTTHSNRVSKDNFLENSAQYSLGYKRTFDKENQELNVYAQTSLDHSDFDYTQRQDYTTPIMPATGTASNSPGKIRETMAEANYAQPIGNDIIIETGVKGFFKTMQSVVDFRRYNADTALYEPDLAQSYGFTYNRNIYAYYLSASFKLFDYIDVKAGGRYEYTKTTANFPDTHIPAYNTFTPSFVASRQIDDSQTLKISYSKRIERPDYDEVNPFINMADPYNIATGTLTFARK